MVLADRTGGVVGSVEAAIADHVLAGPKDVRRAAQPAEQTGLIRRLQEMRQDLVPPQAHGVVGDAVGKRGEERRVRMACAAQRAERLDGALAERGQPGQRHSRQARAQSRRSREAERRPLDVERLQILLGQRLAAIFGDEDQTATAEKDGFGSAGGHRKPGHERMETSPIRSRQE